MVSCGISKSEKKWTGKHICDGGARSHGEADDDLVVDSCDGISCVFCRMDSGTFDGGSGIVGVSALLSYGGE